MFIADTLKKCDGRTREAWLVKRMRADLVAHVGGAPSIVGSALIDQVCQVALRLAEMDRRFADGDVQNMRFYIEASSHLARLLGDLGVKPATASSQTITNIMPASPRCEAAA